MENLAVEPLSESNSSPLGHLLGQLLIHEALIDFFSRAISQKSILGNALAHLFQHPGHKKSFKIRTDLFQFLPIELFSLRPGSRGGSLWGENRLIYRQLFHFLEFSIDLQICLEGSRRFDGLEDGN